MFYKNVYVSSCKKKSNVSIYVKEKFFNIKKNNFIHVFRKKLLFTRLSMNTLSIHPIQCIECIVCILYTKNIIYYYKLVK